MACHLAKSLPSYNFFMAYKDTFELEFIIRNIKFNLDFEDGYFDDNEEKELSEYVESLSREICIDKSYVDCSLNKRTSTFMTEIGWNSLKSVLVDTDYCRFLPTKNHASLVDSLCMMARCYMYECLALKTDNYEHINVMIDPDCTFDIVICKDNSNDWKKYLGKWQTWKYDLSGNYIDQDKCK